MPSRPKNLEAIEDFRIRYGLGSSIDRMMAALGW
jgi:hypothetical protein